MLMISLAFAPIVSAQADQQKNVLIENEIADIMDAAVILKDDAESKIAAVESDGFVLYAMSWNDSEVEGRVNFALISEEDLISKGYLNAQASELVSNADLISAVTRASASFWYGSYAQTYGNSLTGGVQIHFSQRDALMVTTVAPGVAGPVIGAAIGSVVPGLGTGAGAVVGGLIASLVPIYYWRAQNTDGSLDVTISYVTINAIAYGIPGAGHFIMLGRIYHYFK
ncbi:hypothetical protein [Methanimicrococcus stummii]|nr:hypothetical protein [Methanimicrococcus sp. Es2]